MAVLIAQAIGLDGKRRILGVAMGLGEAETFWRAFLQSLIERGLCGVRLTLAPALQVQVLPVTTMRVYVKPCELCLAASPGNVVSIICNKMP